MTKLLLSDSGLASVTALAAWMVPLLTATVPVPSGPLVIVLPLSVVLTPRATVPPLTLVVPE